MSEAWIQVLDMEELPLCIVLWSLVVALLLYVAAELYETYTIFVVRRQRLLGVVPVLAGDKFELGEKTLVMITRRLEMAEGQTSLAQDGSKDQITQIEKPQSQNLPALMQKEQIASQMSAASKVDPDQMPLHAQLSSTQQGTQNTQDTTK